MGVLAAVVAEEDVAAALVISELRILPQREGAARAAVDTQLGLMCEDIRPGQRDGRKNIDIGDKVIRKVVCVAHRRREFVIIRRREEKVGFA